MAQMCLKTVLSKLLAEGVSKDSIHRMRFKTMGNHFGTSGYNIPSLKYLDKEFSENTTQKPIPADNFRDNFRDNFPGATVFETNFETISPGATISETNFW